jgi:hypothetical protein
MALDALEQLVGDLINLASSSDHGATLKAIRLLDTSARPCPVDLGVQL